MHDDWPTKLKDLKLARFFIELYAVNFEEQKNIGLFEIHANLVNKSLDFQVSPWVLAMTQEFQNLYGLEQGEWVARKVLTLCFTQEQTIH
jgi:hypothetical protein